MAKGFWYSDCQRIPESLMLWLLLGDLFYDLFSHSIFGNGNGELSVLNENPYR